MAYLTDKDRQYQTAEDICAHVGDDYAAFNGAIVPPIYQNSLFVQPTDTNGIAENDYIYSRVSNPTLEVAERKIAAFLPEYLDESYLTAAMESADGADEDFPICAIRLTRRDKMVAGRTALSHRDYLGSLLGLGIRRETLGDLYVSEDGCDVICVKSMAAFLLENVTGAGRVSLDARQIALSEVVVPEKKVKVIRDTVASLRLDGVASAGFSLSRGKTAEAIAAGKCEVNARLCEKGDREVHEGDIVSIRGLGRMKLTEVGGNSKKGRIIITIERYL